MYAKIIKWLCYALMIASIAIAVVCIIKGFVINEVDPLTGQSVEKPSFFTDLFIKWGYLMAILPVAIIVICGTILGIKNNPKGLIVLFCGLLALIAVIVVAYMLAPGTPIADHPETSTFNLKLADTALYVTYFAIGGVFLSLIAGGLYRLVKR